MAEVETVSDGSDEDSMEVETTWKALGDLLLEFDGFQVREI